MLRFAMFVKRIAHIEDRDRAADKVFGGPVQSSCSADLFSRSAALDLDRQKL